jgi:hypothetical protein
MPVYAQYDAEGTIVGIVEVDEAPEGVVEIVVPAGEHQNVTELELDNELGSLSAAEILSGYRVDPATGRLAAKPKPRAQRERRNDRG